MPSLLRARHGMPARNSKQILFIDAFAGCGGLSLASCKPAVAACLQSKKTICFETLKTNLIGHNTRYRFNWPKWLPQEPISMDALLSRYSKELVKLSGSVDLLVGGPHARIFERRQAQAR